MTYQVVVLRRAEQDLHAAADWIAEYSPESAARWLAPSSTLCFHWRRTPNAAGLLRRTKHHRLSFVNSSSDRDKAGLSKLFSLSQGIKCEYFEFEGPARIFSQPKTSQNRF